MLVAGCIVLGLVIGSFLNVVIHRVPRGESIVAPASRCPACGTPIAPVDTVPVLSWLALRGRCRVCGATISTRYPLVEAGCGALFGGVAWRFGWSWELPAYLLVAAALLALAAIDLEHEVVPDAIVAPAVLATSALLGVAAGVGEEPGAFGRALIGALAGLGLMLVVQRVAPTAVAGADERVAVLAGLALGYLGWGEWLLGFGLAFALAALALGAGRVLHRVTNREAVPFGPFLAAATMVAVIWGPDLLRAIGVRS